MNKRLSISFTDKQFQTITALSHELGISKAKVVRWVFSVGVLHSKELKEQFTSSVDRHTLI